MSTPDPFSSRPNIKEEKAVWLARLGYAIFAEFYVCLGFYMKAAQLRNTLVTDLESKEQRNEELVGTDNRLREFGERKSHPRLWTVSYVCTVSLQCFFLLGFVGGSTSPMLSELSDKQDDYMSLRKKRNQDLFNVSH